MPDTGFYAHFHGLNKMFFLNPLVDNRPHSLTTGFRSHSKGLQAAFGHEIVPVIEHAPEQAEASVDQRPGSQQGDKNYVNLLSSLFSPDQADRRKDYVNQSAAFSARAAAAGKRQGRLIFPRQSLI